MNLRKKLTEIQGGTLGIVHLREIVIKVKNMTAALKRWQNFLIPHQMDENHLVEIGEGPAIRFLQGEKDHIASLKFKVESLSKAKDFLSEKGLLGEVDGTSIKTDPAKFWELLFEFSE